MRWMILIIACCLFACQEKAQLPIAKDKMARVLKDMLVAEAAINRVGRSIEDSLQNQYYQQIYQIHEIDSTQLANSFKMMQENPELAESLYKAAEDLLVDAESALK